MMFCGGVEIESVNHMVKLLIEWQEDNRFGKSEISDTSHQGLGKSLKPLMKF